MEKINSISQPKLNMLAAVKFIAMFCIIWWHIELPNPQVDLGARMCELLFVASGFLVAYNSFYKEVNDSWSQSFRYMFKKAANIWHLHIITLILVIIINFKNYTFDTTWWINLFLNIFMLHAWFDNSTIYFGFNSISWFLSALMFCYFLSPFLLKYCKRVKTSLILYSIVATLRILSEVIRANFYGFSLKQSIHVFPIYRFLEFAMGMLVIPLFMSIKDKALKFKEKHKNWTLLIFSLVEVLSILFVIFLMVRFDNTWYRGYYVFFFSVFVFLISFDLGIFAKIFSFAGFKLLFDLQLEMYLFQSINNFSFGFVVNKLFPILLRNMKMYVCIEIIVLLLIAWVYHKLISKHLTKLCNKFFNFMGNLFKEKEEKSKS